MQFWFYVGKKANMLCIHEFNIRLLLPMSKASVGHSLGNQKVYVKTGPTRPSLMVVISCDFSYSVFIVAY